MGGHIYLGHFNEEERTMIDQNVGSKVIIDVSMSLDGYIAASHLTAEAPLGAGGERLHEWVTDSEDNRNRSLLEEAGNSLGAVITGRVTYDAYIPWWGEDGTTGAARKPVFVLTHQVPKSVPELGVYTYVTDGIESILKKAKRAANGKDVCVMGGANVAQQF